MSSVALGDLIASGRVAEVYAYGAMTVKLYKDAAQKRSAFREGAILAIAESLGLPAPNVFGVQQIGDRWGVIMSRADGPTFADAAGRRPDLGPKYLEAMAILQLRLHGQPATLLGSLKARLAANIRHATILGEPRRDALLTRLAQLPEGGSLCHGDFHPSNILGPPGHEILVDWLDASCGDPAADVCRSYVVMKPSAPDLASAYVDAYTRLGGESRERIFGWLPFVAAARLAEGIASEADGLMEMAGSI
jgi:tRNA A-37 threonylcarbamoyl transferase component Bud32